MTPEQESQFNLYGCSCRCLIKLSELQHKPISKNDFIDRFAPRYPNWNTECGVTCTSIIIDIARDLQLCNHAETLADTPLVKKFLENGQTRGILVRNDRTRNSDGHLIENHHCRLHLEHGLGPQKTVWKLWHPNPDGKDFEIGLLECQLIEELVHFLVLQ